MKIAIAKPEWGFTGGFELVLRDVADVLRAAGHLVRWATVPAVAPNRTIGDVDVPEDHWAASSEFFSYASLLERFAALDVDEADLVVTTQPGTWAVRHPHKLAIFYHHHRVAYDLEEHYVRAGLADPRIHTVASRLIRELDRDHLGTVSHFLVPSETVADRLVRFSGVPRSAMSEYLAAPQHGSLADAPPGVMEPEGSEQHVLCVSRSEFTKRTELFAAAAFEGFGRQATLVGEGGRLPFLRRYVSDRVRDVPRCDEPWFSPASTSTLYRDEPNSPIDVRGWVGAAELSELYANAGVVVAPAYDEDYGLTLLEAMSYGKPVVVCSDGGGLTEMIDDGRTGIVAEPTPAAVSAAVRSLVDDPALARELGKNGRCSVTAYSVEQASRQLLDGVERVMSR